MTALVIDEAHSLPNELLEEVRLLANIEKPDQKLLTVILVGQPELAGRLNDPSLRQLKQRVALRCELVPLTLRESAAYIAKRISLAGGDSAQVFTREAVLAVYEYSGGIPRTINVLCDNALVSAFARDESLVSQQVVAEVARDFDLQPPVRLRDQSLMATAADGGPHPPAASAPSTGPPRQLSGQVGGAADSTGRASSSTSSVVVRHPSPRRRAPPRAPPTRPIGLHPRSSTCHAHCRWRATIRRRSGDPSGRRSSSGSDEPTKR